MKDQKITRPEPPQRRVHKVVLTGGPCGGKTTGQAKLATFFENLGWKVFRVPETATVLMSGGISFGELNEEQVMDFQEHLVATMMALEDTYFSMAEKCDHNCLVIADRGTMDASAFIDRENWEKILAKLNLEEIEISDNRYNHVVHMQSAAIGAEKFYTVEDHTARFEGLELARERDCRAMEAWRDHPYVDIVDNRSDFDCKVNRLIELVVRRIGLDVADQLQANARKVKFIVSEMPPDSAFPVKFTDFEVVHHYLRSTKKGVQSRLRKRVKSGRATYTFTVRKPEVQGQVVEVKNPISQRDYANLLDHRDDNHLPIFKTRRCFLYQNQQYSLDIYRDPCHPRCRGLILLQTFTTMDDEEILNKLPPFISATKNVTSDPAFSMYNLSIRSDWTESVDQFCHRLSDDEDDGEEVYDVKKAHERLLVHVASAESPLTSLTCRSSLSGYSSDSSTDN
jgi:predicted ATPase